MRILQGEGAAALVTALESRRSHFADVVPMVRRIVDEVRSDGDAALRKYARRFDGLEPKHKFVVSKAEMDAAWDSMPADLRSSVRLAAANIRRFGEWQKPKPWRRAVDGIVFGQLVRPLKSAGCYVPAGRFPLLSTLLMTVIPAQVAGVENIRVVSPRPSRQMLGTAAMLGAREFYRIGGAQAIAALAYGTETIPPVDKIVGPGNSYVTAAKMLVSSDCAIDMLSGPTETVIVSRKGNPAFIAADLKAQAEHDPQALPVFITTSENLAFSVAAELEHGGLVPLRKNAIASKAVQRYGAVLIASSKKQAFAWANRIAPEHITVEKGDLGQVRNAGSIFVGDYSVQAAGDYACGPNHVLPTSGGARFRGGLSVLDFVKLITLQEVSPKGLQRIAPDVMRLAETEGLRAHADSVRARCAHA
ncbi:MAG: histidinol dehydrogenase [Acidobacteria bacterium]|nr:histidinol dehydrogenase [Acidobacteriota bacterium]